MVLATIDLEVEDLDSLLAAKKELMDPVAEQVFADNGHMWQVVVRTETGIRLLNLWRDAGGRDRANDDPRLAAARAAVLEQTGATASYASYDVLALSPAAAT